MQNSIFSNFMENNPFCLSRWSLRTSERCHDIASPSRPHRKQPNKISLFASALSSDTSFFLSAGTT